MLKTQEIQLDRSAAMDILADPDDFIAKHGLAVEVGLHYDSDEDWEPTSHYLSGNLLNLALHLRDDVAASRLLDRGIAVAPAYYSCCNALDDIEEHVHPIEPATNFGLLQATKRLLARGVDFSWHNLGIAVLSQPEALTTLRLAGWKDEATWVARAATQCKLHDASGPVTHA